MRELKRSIARHMMELHGMEQINKKTFSRPFKPGELDKGKRTSFFALHWKAYLNPKSKERKSLHAVLRRREARNARYGKCDRSPWPIARS